MVHSETKQPLAQLTMTFYINSHLVHGMTPYTDFQEYNLHAMMQQKFWGVIQIMHVHSSLRTKPLAWPHFLLTKLHSPPNGDFCPRIWASLLFLWLDLRSLDYESTKIGPNFRKQTTSKNEVITKWFYYKLFY